MQAFMNVPCNIWFTLDQKVEAYLDACYKILGVQQAQIDEALAFVKSVDYETIADEAIQDIFQTLEHME